MMKALSRLVLCVALMPSLCAAVPQEALCMVQTSTRGARSRLVKTVRPFYPPLAKQARIQGTVVLLVTISPQGKVSSAEVSSGHPLLVQSAIDAVQQWEYQPYMQNGQPCAVNALVEVPFELDSSDANSQSDSGSQPPTVVRISSGVADGLLIKKVDPVYPQMAKIAHIEGDVVLRILISTAGKIVDIKAISGHPVLIQSAIEAVRQWEYRPYQLNGQPVTVDAPVMVRFSMRSKEEIKKFEAALHAFNQQEEQCGDLVSRRIYTEAESSCSQLPKLADKLDPSLVNERVRAYRDVAIAFYAESKFSDALAQFLQELKMAKAQLGPVNSGLARAYADTARALQATGELAQADSDYQKSVKILEHNLQMASEASQKEVSRQLQEVLNAYAGLLRQMGKTADAETMEKRAHELAPQTGLQAQP